jgi:hypothetical protein
MYDGGGALLYVGISSRLMRRMSEHKRFSHWFNEEVEQIKLEKFETRELVLAAEAKAIKTEKPKYNVHHKIVEKLIGPQKAWRRSADAYLTSQFVASLPPDPPPVQLYNPLYSLSGAASAMHIGTTLFKRLIERGEIRPFEIDGKRFVSGWQILEYIESKELAADAEHRRENA